jgi:hypothetical protein
LVVFVGVDELLQWEIADNIAIEYKEHAIRVVLPEFPFTKLDGSRGAQGLWFLGVDYFDLIFLL